MKVIYTNAPGRESGVCYRYPRPFFGPIAAAQQVIVVGDHPHIAEAYRRIGISVETEEGEPGARVLVGSDNFDSTYEIGGETVQLGDLVETAFDESGLTAQEWNELAEADRDARIQAVLERAESEASSDQGGGSDQGDTGDADGDDKQQANDTADESGDTDERDELAAEHEARFGKKPHPAMKVETLREKLAGVRRMIEYVTPEIVRELIEFDPKSGVVTWLSRGRQWFNSKRAQSTWNARYAGKRAGSVWQNGYGYQFRVISFFNKRYAEHRIVWMWMTDDPVPDEIDHRNRNGTDNRWENLRGATHAENGRNVSLRCNNTSGETGVYWNESNRKWRAKCSVDGKQHHVGYFTEKSEAAEAVQAFRLEKGFDPSHGMEPAHYA